MNAYRRANLEKTMHSRAKARALKNGIPFDIDFTDIFVPEFCPVLGLRLQVGDYDAAPSLDRLNPAKGYVKGNINVMSAKANRMKNNASGDEVMLLAIWLKGRLS